MEKKNDDACTCFGFLFLVIDYFELCFKFIVEMVMVHIWIFNHLDRFDCLFFVVLLLQNLIISMIIC
jgi:hypothetical protein